MRDEEDARMEARQRAYALLSALLLEGLDEARLAWVRGLPALAERLPEPVELDALAAEHHALFGHELFPFAGAFLGNDGLVGEGVAADVVRVAHAVVGAACEGDPSPDHLGQGLRLMAVFVEAERQARAFGDEDDVRTLMRWQQRVLDEALLPWMPPLHAALSGQPSTLWTRVVEMAIGVLAQHRATLPGLPRVSDDVIAASDTEAVLDDPRTGLSTVARVLTRPARCGIHLSRRELEAVARRCELPGGFGSRVDVLERLLRSAAEYRQLPRVVDELDRVLATRDDIHAGLEHEPGLWVHVPAWRQRVASTRRMLARLRDAATQVA
ncbi:molecular chaperone TorD family protein [Paraliomyxa miuraensis]|uniref:molecular chaperone TorD family protein n=1 Tax=Paraliomyxa miuraensis TaxID=376150 RepID=UPI002253618E|nr:molecular chaperone TorD family protein [Paraliomyxa miuraensis]MCX4247493.1 molecular chaperone TorD family protein [Paraliomyxa miuraensis]